jgi:hypothetical protein
MKKNNKIIGFKSVLTIAAIAVFLSIGFAVQADNCRLDQSQLAQTGAIAFGNNIVLGQTFVPSVQNRQVCKVKVSIRKNMEEAGDLKLTVLNSQFGELDSATIDGDDIPLGNSVQLFDFGCNGDALDGHQFYGLKLESPTSVVGAYTWKGAAGNPYVQPANRGNGWRNTNGGAGTWTNLGGFDYAFQIYLCD